MEDESLADNILNRVCGALGLGQAVALGAVFLKYGVGVAFWVILSILGLSILLFGGYYFWRRRRIRQRREMFTTAIEAQAAVAPKTLSDPNKRAALDRLRQKFQAGLQEYKTRAKDIYRLPWYVFIGEPGSGKTEAIRHSGIDFPPGLQNELQGSGGTVNMDWWFTNHGVILDTAGSLLFSEAPAGQTPEWNEFLRLLRRARPDCPINGVFIVLSIESLIKDSADKIAQKAGRLAQQLDLIQRTLDVRFPVYLLVTKSDLLTGFRDFFDSVDDPLLQHQMFGWSNPEPLDAPFRADLIEQHLKNVTDRLRRRRLALLLESVSRRADDSTRFFRASNSGGNPPTPVRRAEEVEALFALPESMMRLAPRLRRYLEIIFVAGEWSAKPVFLRGIYFTSSMREGKALDEAIAFATGLPLDQLPEDKGWDKNRAFFLRDLFLEKVFRESGLVTRATNTLKFLRTRRLKISISAAAALLVLLGFAWFGHSKLSSAVLEEAKYWRAGATNWERGEWSPGTIISNNNVFQFAYRGTNLLEVADKQMTAVEYHKRLKVFTTNHASVNWIFKPISWLSGKNLQRPKAQQALFDGSVLKPLVRRTRDKMTRLEPPAADERGVSRYRGALLSLVQLEADRFSPNRKSLVETNSTRYLDTFLSYLTDSDQRLADTGLSDIMTSIYSGNGGGSGKWPPASLLGGDHLTNNLAIDHGLAGLRKANRETENRIQFELSLLNTLTAQLAAYQQAESQWLTETGEPCLALQRGLQPHMHSLEESWRALRAATNYTIEPLTNIAARYGMLESVARNASMVSFQEITAGVPDALKTRGLFAEIGQRLDQFASQAAQSVRSNYLARAKAVADFDLNYVSPTNGGPLFERRWSLYSRACELASAQIVVDDKVIGDGWTNFTKLRKTADQFRSLLSDYRGPYSGSASNICERVAGEAERVLAERFVESYVHFVTNKMANLAANVRNMQDVTNAKTWFSKIDSDLGQRDAVRDQAAKLNVVQEALHKQRATVVDKYASTVATELDNKLGFPIKLHAQKTVKANDVVEAKRIVASLQKNMESTVWESFVEGAARINALRKMADHFGMVVNALIEDDLPAEVDLYFVPTETDKTMLTVFRHFQIAIGDSKTDWTDLTRQAETASLIKARIDGALGIRARKFTSDQTFQTLMNSDSWGVIRLIRDGTAKPLDNGRRWKISIKLSDRRTPGEFVFEARFKQPLPKAEAWPQ